MAKRVPLDSWIRDVLADPDRGGPCTSLSLVHLIGQTPKEIYSKKAHSAMDATDLANLFRSKAETYAQDLPGSQRFAILGFYNNRTEPEATQPFQIYNDQTEYGGMVTEPPNAVGEKMQSMRHQEMMTQLAYRQTVQMAEMTIRQSEILMTQNERLMRDSHEAFNIVRELLLQQANTTHVHRMAEQEHQRSTEERKKILSFAPVLVNTLLGREVFPQSSVDTVLLEGIADALTEEQIGMLSGVLPQDLWGPLAARMATYMQKKNAATEAKRLAASNSNVDIELGR